METENSELSVEYILAFRQLSPNLFVATPIKYLWKFEIFHFLVAEIFSLISFKLGMSATSRKRKEELAEALKKLILSKGKTPALKYQQLFEDIRGQSDIVSVQFFA